MIYIVIFLVLVGLAGFANALDEKTSNTTPKPLEEYYEIEIIGLNDKYVVDEKYSFYFIISGYGYSCAGYEISYPDKNGKIMHMGAYPLCDPNQSKQKFEINSLHHPVSLANVGITNPGTYTVTVTFDKPSKYFPTTVSKEFQVVEKLNEEVNESSPLKQFKAGIAIEKIQCRENLVLVQKYDNSPACVKPESINKLIEREWGIEKRFHGLTKPQIMDIQQAEFGCKKLGNQTYCNNMIKEKISFYKQQNQKSSESITESRFEEIRNNIEKTEYDICDIRLEDNKIIIDLHKFFKDSEPERKIISKIPSDLDYKIFYHDGYSDYFINTITAHSCDELEKVEENNEN